MRINFKPKNKEEIFSILLFYWAYFWRMALWSGLVGIGVLLVGGLLFLLVPTLFTPISLFLLLPIVLAVLITLTLTTLYVFKELPSIKFKTFSVKWIIPEPQSIFEKYYLMKVLIYLGVSTLGSLIVGSSILLVHIFEAFLFYLFIKNEWLPFVIEAKEEGVEVV